MRLQLPVFTAFGLMFFLKTCLFRNHDTFIVAFLNVTKSSFIQATLTHYEKVHLCLNRLYFTAITSFLISIWSIHSAINANCECVHPVPHNTERSVGLISAKHEGWRTNRLWLIWVQIVEDKWELVGGWMLVLLRKIFHFYDRKCSLWCFPVCKWQKKENEATHQFLFKSPLEDLLDC